MRPDGPYITWFAAVVAIALIGAAAGHAVMWIVGNMGWLS